MSNELQFSIQELTDKFFPIYFYRQHLDLACKDILGLDLSPHHRISLKKLGLNKSFNLIFWSRGMGKTVLMAIFYLLVAILYPRIKLMAIGGSGFRASKAVLLEVERLIKGYLDGQSRYGYSKFCLEDPQHIINKDQSYWSITFSNGSIIYGVPLGLTNDGSVIRGLRANVLGQDEAFLIPENLNQAVLEPMQNVLYEPSKTKEEQSFNNMTLWCSTCDFTYREFFKKYERFLALIKEGRKEKDLTIKLGQEVLTYDDVIVLEFNCDDAYYVEKGKRVLTWGLDTDRLYKKKNDPGTDEALWNSENKNQPLDIHGGYFSMEAIEKGSNITLDVEKDLFTEPLTGCKAPCILGIDTAPESANTAFVVIKAGLYSTEKDVTFCERANGNEPCQYLGKHKHCLYKRYSAVVGAYEENKMSQRDRVLKIYDYLDRFNLISIALDFRGGGAELADLLKDHKYIKSLIMEGVLKSNSKPIFDPEEGNVDDGLPILKLYKSTQLSNMLMAGYLKGLITNQRLLLPKPASYYPDDPYLLEMFGHCETLVGQLVRIQGTQAGQGIKFEIETVDPRTGRKKSAKKDLFSALMYAAGRQRELIDEMNSKKQIPENDKLLMPIMFNM